MAPIDLERVWRSILSSIDPTAPQTSTASSDQPADPTAEQTSSASSSAGTSPTAPDASASASTSSGTPPNLPPVDEAQTLLEAIAAALADFRGNVIEPLLARVTSLEEKAAASAQAAAPTGGIDLAAATAELEQAAEPRSEFVDAAGNPTK